jgi:Terminase large subunit, T4likevirus-type, N-terminal
MTTRRPRQAPSPSMTLVDFMNQTDHDTETWAPWRTVARLIDGLPLNAGELALYQQCTGLDVAPDKPVREMFGIVGRRGGKTEFAAIVACWVAFFCKFKRSRGEQQRVLCVAVNKKQADQFMSFVSDLIHDYRRLSDQVVRQTADTIKLRNGISIEIATNSFRSIRGTTIVGAIFDEVAFWRQEDDSKNPDVEVYHAVKPAMLTVPGAVLLGISSPYARSGLLYDMYRSHYGKTDGPMIWQAPTLTMNPSVDEELMASELAANPVAMGAEYNAQFRNPSDGYISRDMVMSRVPGGVTRVPYESGGQYFAWTDSATGIGKGRDSFTLGIARKTKEGADLVFAFERKPPFQRDRVIADCAGFLQQYRLSTVTGDGFARGYVADIFRQNGITYNDATRNRSQIYLAALAGINDGVFTLLDNERLIAQLTGLVMKPGTDGHDKVDHRSGSHDDLANAACGALVLAAEGTGGSQHYGWTALSHSDGVNAAIANMSYWEKYQLQQLGMYGHQSYGAGRPWWE